MPFERSMFADGDDEASASSTPVPMSMLVPFVRAIAESDDHDAREHLRALLQTTIGKRLFGDKLDECLRLLAG
jgi:hypothetical protein